MDEAAVLDVEEKEQLTQLNFCEEGLLKAENMLAKTHWHLLEAYFCSIEWASYLVQCALQLAACFSPALHLWQAEGLWLFLSRKVSAHMSIRQTSHESSPLYRRHCMALKASCTMHKEVR